MTDPDDCPCLIHAETGSCPHGSAVKVRLHLTDTADASERASEASQDLCALLGELSAPGWRVTGYRMHCDECGVQLAEPYPTFGEARAASRAQGWVTVGADDYCPACSMTDRSTRALATAWQLAR